MNIPNRRVVSLADTQPLNWSEVDPAQRQVADLDRAMRRVTAGMERINERLARLERNGRKTDGQ